MESSGGQTRPVGHRKVIDSQDLGKSLDSISSPIKPSLTAHEPNKLVRHLGEAVAAPTSVDKRLAASAGASAPWRPRKTEWKSPSEVEDELT